MKFLSALLVVCSLTSAAQVIWEPVAGYPGTTAATTVYVSPQGVLLVGTVSGVHVQNPGDGTWSSPGPALPVNGIYSHRDHGIFVAYEGALWNADPGGTVWNEVVLPFTDGVRDMILTENGMALVTGNSISIDSVGYYTGSGVWYKPLGQPWEQRNQGLVGSLSFWQLEEAPDGSWYAASADDRSMSGPAGLFRSYDQGLHWSYVPLQYIDPDFGTSYGMELTFPLQLRFTASGLLASVEGSLLGSVPAQMGVYCAWNELGAQALLHPFSLFPVIPPFQSIHPATLQVLPNGNILASRQSFGLQETTHPAGTWESRNQGLVPTYYAGSSPRYHPVHVAWNPYGPHYAVQESDYRLYSREHGLSVDEPDTGSWQLYPNPANSQLTLGFDPDYLPEEVLVVAADGRTVLQLSSPGERQVISVESLPTGIYNVLCRLAGGNTSAQRLVVTR